jgi:riboflavin biosynthesis pyrimidine reductase
MAKMPSICAIQIPTRNVAKESARFIPCSHAATLRAKQAMTLTPTPPLELLYEQPDLPHLDLAPALIAQYGGALGFARPCLYANFVASLDGVVAVSANGDSGPIISQHSLTDRFVMGLLRTCADAIIVGAGTFRKASGHLWHADIIYPPAAALFAETRKRLGLRAHPKLVLVTRSGDIDVTQPALQDAWIATSRAGETALRGRLPASTRIDVLDEPLQMAPLVQRLHAENLRVLLTEGGPSLFSQLVAEKLIDELFLTSSPALFGRFAGDGRKSLADGVDLSGAALRLLSARRDGSHLFLRYAFAR